MQVVKKIAGIVLLIMAGIFSLALLATTPNTILRCSDELAKSGAGGVGYILGSLFVIAIVVALIWLMVKKGLRLVSKKTVAASSVDEIGS